MRDLKDNPCIGCVAPKRHPGCHDKCPDYIIAKAFHEAERKADFEQRAVTQYAADNHRKNSDTARRRRQNFKGHNWRHS